MKLWNKYLVQRRDGTVPEWPWMVLGACDPAAPAALRAYAKAAREFGMDSEYADEVEGLAGDFERYQAIAGEGDPDAPPHREDDPAVVSRFGTGGTERRGLYESLGGKG